jgi:hypothetical protein
VTKVTKVTFFEENREGKKNFFKKKKKKIKKSKIDKSKIVRQTSIYMVNMLVKYRGGYIPIYEG